MKTVKDLKDFLEEMITTLEERYDDEEVLDIVTNTYFIKSNTFLATRNGFVDLRNPVENKEYEDEEDY